MSPDQRHVLVEEGGIVSLPHDYLADLGWQPGDDLTIESTDNGLIMRRANPDEA